MGVENGRMICDTCDKPATEYTVETTTDGYTCECRNCKLERIRDANYVWVRE